jgi:hypothetical protein
MIALTLALEKTMLVVGEDTRVRVTIANRGAATVTLRDPRQDPRTPKLVLRDLQGRPERRLAQGERARIASHEFAPELPVDEMDLAPGEEVIVEESLEEWLGELAAGDYELHAVYEGRSGAVTSKPDYVSVAKLALLDARLVGAHSGSGSAAYVVYSHAAPGTTSVFLSVVTFDLHAHPSSARARRLADLDHPARVVPSVTPNKLPYPAHWLAWKAGDELWAMYERQGRAEVGPGSRASGVASSEIVSPLALDLAGNDGSRPGRAWLALWDSGAPRLLTATLDEQGAFAWGPSHATASGALLASRTFVLSGGERVVLLALQRGGHLHVERVTEDRGSAPVAGFVGQHLGFGAALDRDDTILGAAVVSRGTPSKPEYAFERWSVRADGSLAAASPIAIAAAVSFARAIVGVSTRGRAAAMLRDDAGAWWCASPEGTVTPLPAASGDPIDVFWLDDEVAFAVVASPDEGIRFRTMVR